MTALAVDEIFFRATPVLVAVCPHSFAWVVGQKGPDRSGATWAAALAGFDAVDRVAGDGGTGLAAGVAALQRRQAAAARRPAAMHLDLFHLARDANRARRQVWQQAERAWDADRDADRRRATHAGMRRSAVPVRPVRARAAAAYASADRQERAWARIAAALDVFRPDGGVNDRGWAAAAIAAARVDLTHPAWGKVKRALDDPRTLAFLDDLPARLTAAVPDEPLRAAVVELWRLRHGRGERTAGRVAAEAVQTAVCRAVSADWAAAYDRVCGVLRQVVRASSAVECVNSVVRMHQARQRNVTQGMLDLKRLWWNTRRFGAGKRKGKSPYDLLGIPDAGGFWAVLNVEPADLARRLGLPPETENLSTS